MLVINGVDIPTPNVMDIDKHDLDSSDTHRNELGIIVRDRIRRDVYKLQLEFWAKTSSEIHTINTAIQDEEFPVTFPTPTGNVTKTMYAGDRSLVLARYSPEGFTESRWTLKFNLVEC